jgi:hypothetical protein
VRKNKKGGKNGKEEEEERDNFRKTNRNVKRIGM